MIHPKNDTENVIDASRLLTISSNTRNQEVCR